MAITKTHPIKSTLKKAIDYICNLAKTDGKLLGPHLDVLLKQSILNLLGPANTP